MDGNESLGEKARCELRKNATYCFEKILEATPKKMAVVWPLISHVRNYPNKMIKT